MQHYASVRIINIVLAMLAGLGLSSCVAYDRPYGPGYGHAAPPATVVYYSYWYYPNVQVYFDVNRQIYFYFSNNRWVQARVLPPTLRARLGSYVPIHSRYNQPYIEHHEHSRKYPPHSRAERYPPSRYDEHPAPPGHSGPMPHGGYQVPYKQPPPGVTNDSHSKPSDKDKVKDKDKNKKTTKDAKTRHDKDKQKPPAKKKAVQDEQDEEQRDSR